MTRTVPGALLTTLDNPQVDLFTAVEMLFDDNDGTRWDQSGYSSQNAIRLWTGYGNKTLESNTYTGSGSLLTVSGLEEVSDLSSKGATVTLSGLDSSIVTLALTSNYQGRLARIYWGIGTNHLEAFSGFMDQMSISDSGETTSISLSLESRLIVLERASTRRYTSESHAAVRVTNSRTGSDTFFDWVTPLQDKKVPWGRSLNEDDT